MNKAEWEFLVTLVSIITFVGFMTGCLALSINTTVAYIAFFVGSFGGCLTVLTNGIKEMKR